MTQPRYFDLAPVGHPLITGLPANAHRDAVVRIWTEGPNCVDDAFPLERYASAGRSHAQALKNLEAEFGRPLFAMVVRPDNNGTTIDGRMSDRTNYPVIALSQADEEFRVILESTKLKLPLKMEGLLLTLLLYSFDTYEKESAEFDKRLIPYNVKIHLRQIEAALAKAANLLRKHPELDFLMRRVRLCASVQSNVPPTLKTYHREIAGVALIAALTLERPFDSSNIEASPKKTFEHRLMEHLLLSWSIVAGSEPTIGYDQIHNKPSAFIAFSAACFEFVGLNRKTGGGLTQKAIGVSFSTTKEEFLANALAWKKYTENRRKRVVNN